MGDLSIAIGGTHNVYEPEAVAKALSRADAAPSGELLRRTYERMLEVGPQRFVSKPASSRALEPLNDACPNFSGIVEDLRKYVELALFGSSTLSFVPILLAGDPGAGKTYFASQLANALNVPHRFISMGTVSAGWLLSGSAPTWQGAKYGKVAQTLIEEQFANPLVLLDELDKTGGDARYDPFGALLELLERDTACHFTDEYLDVEMDTSAIFWIATANDLTRIPDYILSRMMVYEVPYPTAEQSAIIAQRIYAGLLTANGWQFEPELSHAVMEKLAAVSPRDMKKRLLDAMGAARLAGRDFVNPEDVNASHAKKRNSIGFTGA